MFNCMQKNQKAQRNTIYMINLIPLIKECTKVRNSNMKNFIKTSKISGKALNKLFYRGRNKRKKKNLRN